MDDPFYSALQDDVVVFFIIPKDFVDKVRFAVMA